MHSIPFIVGDAIPEVGAIDTFVAELPAEVIVPGIVDPIWIHGRSTKQDYPLRGWVFTIRFRVAESINGVPIITDKHASFHITLHEIILGVSDIQIGKVADVHVVVGVPRPVIDIVMEEDRIPEGRIVGEIERISPPMDLYPHAFSLRFGMGFHEIVVDKKEALMAAQIRVIPFERVVPAIAVIVKERSQVFGFPQGRVPMGRPGEDVHGREITGIGPVVFVVFDLPPFEFPNPVPEAVANRVIQGSIAQRSGAETMVIMHITAG